MTPRLVTFLVVMQVLLLAYGLCAALSDEQWLRALHLPIVGGATLVVLAVVTRGGAELLALLRSPRRTLLVLITLFWVVMLCSASAQLVLADTWWVRLGAVLIGWGYTCGLWWNVADASAPRRGAVGAHASGSR